MVELADLVFVLAVAADILIQIEQPGPVHVDFRAFWGAARLLLERNPSAAFEQAELARAGGFAEERWLPWVYAPGFMLLLAPFGLLPFIPAWLLFNAVSVAALALALRPFIGPARIGATAFLFAPALLPCLLLGQNSILWLAACLFAFSSLRDGRQVLAGVGLGIMTLKPQLGVMIPFALLGLGAWRAIAAATVTTVLVAGLPTLVVGAAYWQAFQRALEIQGDFMVNADLFAGMVSVYSTLIVYGVPASAAMAVQISVAAIMTVAIRWVWSRRHVSFDLKLALMFCTMSLAPPYFWFYDAAALALAALFFLRSGIAAQNVFTTVIFTLLWLGATPALFVLIVADIPWLEARHVVVPVLIAALALCFRQVFRTPNRRA